MIAARNPDVAEKMRDAPYNFNILLCQFFTFIIEIVSASNVHYIQLVCDSEHNPTHDLS